MVKINEVVDYFLSTTQHSDFGFKEMLVLWGIDTVETCYVSWCRDVDVIEEDVLETTKEIIGEPCKMFDSRKWWY